jgi:hypothetical protein
MIHPSAIIDKSAIIADDVEIGPFSIIGEKVEIQSGTWIGPHVVLSGPTKIGKNNKIYQFASIGDAPQDLRYAFKSTYYYCVDYAIKNGLKYIGDFIYEYASNKYCEKYDLYELELGCDSENYYGSDCMCRITVKESN